MTLLRTDTELLFKSLKDANDVLTEVVDYMISFRTIHIGEISLELLSTLSHIVELTITRNHKFPKRMLKEPEKEFMPKELALGLPKLKPFQELIVMYSESSIYSNVKEILRGIGVIQTLLEILEVNMSIVDEDDGIPV